MKKKISFFIVLAMIISLLSVPVLAATPTSTQVKVVIDLSYYYGEVTGTFNGEAVYANTVNEYIFANGVQIPASEITLTDFGSGDYKSWDLSCDGIDDLVGNFVYESPDENPDSYVISAFNKDHKNFKHPAAVLIKVQGNKITIAQSKYYKNNYSGKSIILTPIFSATGFTATAESLEPSMGSANAYATNVENLSKIVASAEDGYSFDYWSIEGSEERINENPYTVTLTANSNFIAHFKEWNQPTVVAEPEEGGIVTSRRVKDDTWEMTATANPNYSFEGWTGPNELSSSNATIEVLVAESGDTYTANFAPVKLTLLDEAQLLAYTENASNITVNSYLDGSSAVVGSRALMRIPFEPTGAADNVTVTVKLYSGNTAGTPFATHTFSDVSLSAAAGLYHANIVIDPMPDVSQIAAEVILTAAGFSETSTKTYSVGDLIPSEENGDFVYVQSPAKTIDELMNTMSAQEKGPNIAGIYADIDPETDSATLYFYGSTGVYKLDETQNRLYELEGLAYATQSDYKGVAAIGSDGEGGLIAVVSGAANGTQEVQNWDGSISYLPTPSLKIDSVTTPGYDASSWTGDIYGTEFLWRWNGEAWSLIDNSCFSEYYDSGSGIQFDTPLISSDTAALIMSGTDIWENAYHWDGSQWTAHEYSFNSFYRISDTLAFAGANDGLYQYNGEGWTKLGELSEAASIISGSADSLIVKTGAYSSTQYYKVTTSNGAASVVDTASLEMLSSIGIDHEGELYAITRGRSYGGMFDAFNGAYVYKMVDGSWVYQIMTNFDDANEDDNPATKVRPDSVSFISSPIERLSFMYGSAGAVYMFADYATITFESNGGSPVDSLTARIGSRITPPTSPTREGYTFVGWYTLDNFMTNGASYAWGVMPAADIVLYAKWTENSSGEDPFDAEREKAHASLDETVARLDKDDYGADIWEQIRAAQSEGHDAIDDATTYDGIYAALNAAVDKITELAKNTSGIITVAVTIEKLTVDGTYIVEPTLVDCAKYERASVVVTDLLKDYWADSYDGTPYRLGPNCTETSDFYLAGVWDGVTMLSEFDHGDKSGWMYCVNGSFPGVGASAWTLKNGDVMRWQYTCNGLGADIGSDNSAWGGGNGVTVADKDELIWKIAEINQAGEQSKYGDAYENAISVLADIPASQDDIDAALAALNAAENGGGNGGGSSGGGSTGPVAQTMPFVDVEEGAFYYDAVAWAVNHDPQITNGTSETTFEPNANCLREQIVTFLWRAAGEPAPTITSVPFEDVEEGAYYYDAVLWAYENGITLGVDETHFGVGLPCTREQVVTFLWRAANKPATSVDESFTDVAEDGYYAEAVNWAAEEEITLGIGDGLFGTGLTCTRGQIVTFLFRAREE